MKVSDTAMVHFNGRQQRGYSHAHHAHQCVRRLDRIRQRKYEQARDTTDHHQDRWDRQKDLEWELGRRLSTFQIDIANVE